MNTKINNMVILKKDLSDGAFKLYCILAMLAGKSNRVSVYISQLADMFGKSNATVRTRINELIEIGLIDRILCKSSEIPTMNTASIFILKGNGGM